MDNSLENFRKFGFREVGKWERDKNEDGEISFLVKKGETEQNRKEWVYAFVVDKEVMYVGQTKKTLKERMGGYENPYESQGRNRRGNGQIKDVLNEDHKEVFVYAISLNEIKTKKINIVGEEIFLKTTDAFEMIVIGEMNPDWNINGKENKDLPKNIKIPGFMFKQVNEWKLDGGKIHIALDKPEYEKEGWFYFFASNNKKIIHVGTTDRTLEKIMDNYKGGHKEGTSIRIHKDIKAVLEKTGKVFVYAAQFDASIDKKNKNIIKYGIERALEDELNEEETEEQNEDD